MRKYWLIFRNTWDESLVYRLNFILWRVRVIIRFMITYFLWSSIFSSDRQFFGYTRESMLTYVLLVFIVSNFVFATRTQDIGNEINEGKLTNYLLRPISYFKSIASRDISDKVMNFIFTLVEFVIFFLILQPSFILQTNLLLLFTASLALTGGVIVYFCMSCLLGFLGFWTTETWGIRFIFIILLDFLAGNFIPIDILPPLVAKTLLLTPFPYMFYFPIKIYIGQLSFGEILFGLIVLLTWIAILMKSVSRVWQSGLRLYSAEGR